MDNLENKDTAWIKNLVRMEQDIEASGQVSLPEAVPGVEELSEHTHEFMRQLRAAFTSYCSVFNHIKGFLGSLRIYGIANTKTDFMLFRHGHKLIFSVKDPGLIAIRFNFNTPLSAEPAHQESADFLKGEWGAFNELKWTYNNDTVNIDYLIRYYISLFVKNSLK